VEAWSDRFVAEVSAGLSAGLAAAAAVPGDVEAMTAYMRGQFTFLGVRAAGQRAAMRAALVAAGRPVDETEVLAAIDALWARPQREYRYAGCDLAGRFASKASPEFVDHATRWITIDPWWDTCDALARRCTGQVVRRYPALRSTMDRWLAGDNLWLRRSAILHMGGWHDSIDRDWVFAACLARAGDTDFFIRKAIGWILRDLAWVDPGAVVAFVEGPGAAVLSNLSKREALKNVVR
jgi:3-methyladenine DNA glycosylase AlkD